MRSATSRNLEYYGQLADGRADYWRHMAAPRMRVGTILRILREARPESLLDIGCGDGSLIIAAHTQLPSASCAGLDLSPAQIETNRQRRPDIEWIAGNVEDPSLEVRSRYSAIVASELIEHLDDPERFLLQLRRFANPEALLVLSTQSGRVGETERRVGHLRHFSAEEMRSLLEIAGWTPVRIWNAGFPFHDWSKRVANLAPNQMMHRFGERRYGVMERFASFVLRLLFHVNSNRHGAQLFAIARLQR